MLPLNANRLAELYRNAVIMMQTGKHAEAIKAFEALVPMAPKRAEFEFHIGQILAGNAQFRAAIAQFEKAISKAPAELAVWQSYADSLAALGDKQAVAAARKTLKKSKFDHKTRLAVQKRMSRVVSETRRVSAGITSATIQRLTAQVDNGLFEDTARETEELARQNPRNEIVHLIFGASLTGLDRLDEAESAFRKALDLAPDYGEAQAYLGELLENQGRHSEALEYLQRARILIPQSPVVLGNLGRTYANLSRRKEAAECLDKLLDILPDNLAGRLARAENLNEMDDPGNALIDIQTALAANGSIPSAHITHSKILKRLGRDDEALLAADKAIALQPDSIEALSQKALIFQSRGAFDDAYATYIEALALDGQKGQLYRQIAIGRTFQVDDPIVERMQSIFAEENQSDAERMELGFALVKAMEDTGQFDKVWTYLKTANDLMRKSVRFDPKSLDRERAQITRIFKDMDTTRIGKTGYADNRSIFVSGLPRSGTTLVEQILASHSTVTGGGELGLFTRPAMKLLGAHGLDRVHVSDVTDDEATTLGRGYQDELDERFPDAGRVTDKSIGTHQVAGLAWLALPNSKLVILDRDPRDNLLSMYRNRFSDGAHTYTYALSDLLVAYKKFMEIRALWREIAPDRFYEIKYEELVQNPEAETRKLLAFCDLEWEDACLDFHKTKRKVETLSLYQVRQPMYNSSVGAWRRYEAELGDFLQGLEDMGATF